MILGITFRRRKWKTKRNEQDKLSNTKSDRVAKNLQTDIATKPSGRYNEKPISRKGTRPLVIIGTKLSVYEFLRLLGTFHVQLCHLNRTTPLICHKLYCV